MKWQIEVHLESLYFNGKTLVIRYRASASELVNSKARGALVPSLVSRLKRTSLTRRTHG
jgi:hypothetical protein